MAINGMFIEFDDELVDCQKLIRDVVVTVTWRENNNLITDVSKIIMVMREELGMRYPPCAIIWALDRLEYNGQLYQDEMGNYKMEINWVYY